MCVQAKGAEADIKLQESKLGQFDNADRDARAEILQTFAAQFHKKLSSWGPDGGNDRAAMLSHSAVVEGKKTAATKPKRAADDDAFGFGDDKANHASVERILGLVNLVARSAFSMWYLLRAVVIFSPYVCCSPR